MTTIDDRIRGALDEDDRDFLASLETERGLFRQLGDTWKGPMGGWAKFAFAMSIVFGALMIFVIIQVIHTHDVELHTLWAIALLAVLVMLGFIKQWIFERMNMLTILREVKRLQVQVAMLDQAREGDED
ncbi:hypothetical protein N0B51_06395 [Tsuneonella sp. YG55]|uniref:Uncharacterized protein n=1 Tax=Tsuneonella litorea TaxID=2976475 RepID=A0A9X2W0J9_9SPHN|nr:DUF6768 family protein [Tsuneonella litorea]MCT2558606.1 hypothetical protein [Tsuneonella litorea]